MYFLSKLYYILLFGHNQKISNSYMASSKDIFIKGFFIDSIRKNITLVENQKLFFLSFKNLKSLPLNLI